MYISIVTSFTTKYYLITFPSDSFVAPFVD